ncbi:MAG TPA: hypothetical protein VFN67_42015 [Polyangiales bacterium]|nr:hypothetical protein [Polyangiales bacterium]
MMTRWQTFGVASLLFTGLTGCVFGEESDPPVLSVDLYWDFDQRTGHDWSCDSVPVEHTEVHLRDSKGEERDLDDGGDRGCEDRLYFPNLDLGDYEIEVIGYNEAGDKAWETICPVWLDRFDRLFECTVNQIDP